MQTIYKYPIETTDNQKLILPEGYEILCVQIQNGQPCLWGKVVPNNDNVEVNIYTFGTGHNIDMDVSYVGTYQLNNGNLVFHVFKDKVS